MVRGKEVPVVYSLSQRGHGYDHVDRGILDRTRKESEIRALACKIGPWSQPEKLPLSCDSPWSEPVRKARRKMEDGSMQGLTITPA